MRDRKNKSRLPILAAGGIVLRGDRGPQIAVVQSRKLGAWGLPKGKLAAGEDAVAAARREVLEETGHRVTVHEFLGTLAYEAGGRPKVVQFWRMQARGEPIGALMHDVKAVRWLPLEDAIDQLTRLRERAFLEQVGPVALKFAERSASRETSRRQPGYEDLVHCAPAAARVPIIGRGVPLVPTAGGDPAEHTEPIEPEPTEQDLAGRAELVPAADVLGLTGLPGPTARDGQAGVGRSLIEKTRVWLRHATMLHRGPPD